MAKRKIRIRSGELEAWMEVTEEEYQKYYRPWWQQKKREQRNREAMEECGYKEESYEEWKENDMRTELFAESTEELMVKVFGEEMPLIDFANMKKRNPRTLSDHKRRILSKLRHFFIERGFDIEGK